MEAIEKEVGAEINDSYKAVLVDTTVEKYLDKQTGKEKIQIKDPERKEKYVLYCVLKSIPQDQVRDNTVFELWSELEPWKKESKRGQLATRFYDYNIITDEKKSEALKKAKVKVDELYRELIPKRKAQQEALTEYFKLIERKERGEREYSEETKQKANELIRDPTIFYKFGEALSKGFYLPDINRIRYIIGEEDKKRHLGINIGTSPFMDTINIAFGEIATVKDTMAKMIFRLTGVRVMDRGYLTAAGLRYSKDREEADVLYLPEADLKGEKGRQMRLMRSDDGGFEIEYAYKDKDSGLMETEKLKVDAKSIVITTNDVTFDEAFQSGAWLFQTDDSEALTKKVIPEKLGDYEERRKTLSEEDIKTWNCAFDMLARSDDIPEFVKIPYAKKLNDLFDTKRSASRRGQDKICELIQKIAILR
ncbi:hypothetical protein KA005_45520, partial [bacterium]|nr:hypothetical protein [bacterium]